MFKHLLLAVTAGFGVGERAKGMLERYPRAAEIVEKIEALEKTGVAPSFKEVARILEEWGIKLESYQDRVFGDAVVITLPNQNQPSKGYGIEPYKVKKEGWPYIAFVTISLLEGENVGALAALALRDTLYERRDTRSFFLPLLLPYLSKVKGEGFAIPLIDLYRMDKKTGLRWVDHMLKKIADPTSYHCGKVEGEECFTTISRAVRKAYLEAWYAPTFGQFLKAFEEMLEKNLGALPGANQGSD